MIFQSNNDPPFFRWVLAAIRVSKVKVAYLEENDAGEANGYAQVPACEPTDCVGGDVEWDGCAMCFARRVQQAGDCWKGTIDQRRDIDDRGKRPTWVYFRPLDKHNSHQ